MRREAIRNWIRRSSLSSEDVVEMVEEWPEIILRLPWGSPLILS